MLKIFFIKNRHLIVFILAIMPFAAKTQEFNLNIKVEIQANLTVDKSTFNGLESQIKEFINNTRWTDEIFEPHERISGSLQMNITNELDPTTFEAEIILQTTRPVFNSSYETPVIYFIDKHVNFKYSGIETLLKTTNTFYDNLSSVLSFYCYMALALDFDSFSMYGGDPYLEMAREVVNSLPSNYAFDSGWTKDTGNRRNRYYFFENLTNPVYRPFRESYYDYHRTALDIITEDEAKSRAVMQSCLVSMGQVDTASPNSMIIQMFGNSKKAEIIEIYKKAEKGQRTRIVETMVKMDKSKAGDYRELEN